MSTVPIQESSVNCVALLSLFLVSLLGLAVVGFILWTYAQDSSSSQLFFQQNFANLSEVQALYNISALNSSAALFSLFRDKEFRDLDFAYMKGFGQPLPQTYMHLLSDLLLQSLSKQRVVEAELLEIQNEMTIMKCLIALMMVILACTVFIKHIKTIAMIFMFACSIFLYVYLP